MRACMQTYCDLFKLLTFQSNILKLISSDIQKIFELQRNNNIQGYSK